REAHGLLEEAKQKTEEYVTRRKKLAEQKIAQAETEAVNEVRASAVDIAVAAASHILGKKVDAKTSADFFKSSLTEVKSRLN
ncbi:F0F1 ATP synthase subunit B family protein, partial [Phyllobacterium sp. P5_D12]